MKHSVLLLIWENAEDQWMKRMKTDQTIEINLEKVVWFSATTNTDELIMGALSFTKCITLVWEDQMKLKRQKSANYTRAFIMESLLVWQTYKKRFGFFLYIMFFKVNFDFIF